ncbi:serine protease 27 [Aethina tumida]|uniref:serine protease 27 n=1 Tax=Aethina tumida TaxID=116153 RepID=UPI00096B40F4|nr:serine protease 27 [Aethina tumida]
MRAIFLLYLVWCGVATLCAAMRTSPMDGWSRKTSRDDGDDLNALRKGVSVTGRVFVTMFGYPSRCESKGSSHSCTLSFACWLVGGSSQSGCGASPWIVACCVTSKKPHGHLKNNPISGNNELEIKGPPQQQLELREEVPVPVIQKRIDDVDEECGISSDRVFSKRIIGGKEAAFGQYPWQAFIKLGKFQCGGVLVSRKYVATAAHCIITSRLRDILVYLGELDTQDTGKVEELAPAELHRVKKRIVHPNFRYRLTQPDRYDIALLELVTEAGHTFHISPICLPDEDMKLIGRKAVVAGWGKIQPSNELLGTNVLRSATVPILDIRECMAWHKIKQISVELHEEMLCAGHENGQQDACLGDSGGPLIILEAGRWVLAGITSAGFGCGEPHQPGIYHRVPVTTKWIRSVIKRVS